MKNAKAITMYQGADFKVIEGSSETQSVVYIEGYASVYRAYDGAVQQDRDGEVVNTDTMDLSSYMKNPVVVWNHDWDKPVGRVTEITKDSKGIYVKAEVHKLQGQESKFEAVLKGLVRSFSIGFVGSDYNFLPGDVVELTNAELVEVSIAPVQSNPEALFRVTGTKSLGVNVDKSTFDRLKKEFEAKTKNPEGTDAAPKAEDKTDVPENVQVTPEKVQEHITESNNTVKADVNTETKVTVVEPKLDITSLAQAIVAAEEVATKAKEEQEQARIEAENATKLAEVQAQEQKAKDAMDYLVQRRDAILATPATELDVESIEEFYELLDSAKEAIESKVIEAITLAKSEVA